jgi:hypothetical protein
VLVATLVLLPGSSRAGMTFVASLNGAQEVPPNASLGTGTAVVKLTGPVNMQEISVTLNWQNLLAGATAADIHEGAPGMTGPILFSLALGSGAGTTTGMIAPQTFDIDAAEVAQLQAGLLYVEVSTSQFPAGEIRGQLVPEPSSVVLAGTALVLSLPGYGWR